MKCPRCGIEVAGGARFCTSCGGKMEGDTLAAAMTQPPPEEYQAARPAQAGTMSTGAPDRFNVDKMLFEQKKFALVPQYYVFDENGRELFFVRRQFLALKRHIHVYTDKSMQTELLKVLQDKFFEILTKNYTVVAPGGTVIAKLRRRNLISILRRTWEILDTQGRVIGRCVEDSWGKALFRRFGPLGEYLKTDFIITVDGATIGRFIRKITLFDKYALDLTGDPERRFDRRVAVALATLLDSAEGR